MRKPVDVLVTGFTKSPDLLARSLEPLRQLKQEQVIRNIHCVTWDGAELDPFVAPLEDMHDVRLTRVRQPDVQGSPNQRGVTYQVRNLAAALELVPDGALILKWRPDFVAKYEFLRGKIMGFDGWSAVPKNVCFGIAMPPHLFEKKVWIPWADSNSPFFFEDAVFFGRRREIEKLVTPLSGADMEILGDEACGSYAHIVRYAKIFVSRYPLLANYLKLFRFFPRTLEYRLKIVPYMVENGFSWHLLFAHAWILYSQFHVDIGAPDDLSFYANAVNRDADWSRPETLKVTSPYDDTPMWRNGTKAGMAAPSVCRPYGRLMDDAWQKALFTQGVSDLPRATLVSLMENVARCRDGRLAGIEAEFYRGVERIYRQTQPMALAG
jgi:hypothetical protein